MPLSLQLVTAPTTEPVRLDEAKLHLRRGDFADDDLLILGLIQAARSYLETVTRRAFLTQTWKLSVDDFACWGAWGSTGRGHSLALPRPPLASVTSLTYLDTDGVSQTLATTVYGVDMASEPGRIYLKPAQSWPSVYAVPNAVQVTYVAGWTDATKVPASLKQCILLLIAHMYEQREASVEKALSAIPFGVDALMWSNRLLEVV